MRASVHACTVSVRIVSHCVCVHCVFPCRDPVRALRLFLLSYMFIPRVFKPLSVQGPSACTVSVRTVSHCVSLCLRALSFCAGILCVNCALSYMFSPCMFKPLSVQGPSVYFFSFLTCSLHVCTTSIYVQGPSACTASHVFPRVFKPLSVQGPSVYFFPFLHGPSTCVQLIYVCRDPLRALCQCALCLTVSACTVSFRAGPCACTPSFFPFLHGPSTCVQLIYVCRDPLRALCQCALCLTVSACTVFPCRTLCVHSVFFSFLTCSHHACLNHFPCRDPLRALCRALALQSYKQPKQTLKL